MSRTLPGNSARAGLTTDVRRAGKDLMEASQTQALSRGRCAPSSLPVPSSRTTAPIHLTGPYECCPGRRWGAMHGRAGRHVGASPASLEVDGEGTLRGVSRLSWRLDSQLSSGVSALLVPGRVPGRPGASGSVSVHVDVMTAVLRDDASVRLSRRSPLVWPLTSVVKSRPRVP